MAQVMTCPGCQQEKPAAEARYNQAGDLVCRACLAKSQIDHQDQVVAEIRGGKEHGEIIYGSIGAFVLSLISLVVTHRYVIFLFPFGAIVGALLSIVIPARYKEVRQALGWKLIPHYIMATLALLISVLGVMVAYRAFDDRQQEVHRDITFDEEDEAPVDE